MNKVPNTQIYPLYFTMQELGYVFKVIVWCSDELGAEVLKIHCIPHYVS